MMSGVERMHKFAFKVRIAVGAPKSLLDKWAADRIAKTSFDAPGTSTDPK